MNFKARPVPPAAPSRAALVAELKALTGPEAMNVPAALEAVVARASERKDAADRELASALGALHQWDGRRSRRVTRLRAELEASAPAALRDFVFGASVLLEHLRTHALRPDDATWLRLDSEGAYLDAHEVESVKGARARAAFAGVCAAAEARVRAAQERAFELLLEDVRDPAEALAALEQSVGAMPCECAPQLTAELAA